MKKVLKSVLIATAGIGAVAGSTASVVSCGESATQKEIDFIVEIWKTSNNPLPVAAVINHDILQDEVLVLINGIIALATFDGSITLLTTVTGSDLHLPASYTPGAAGTRGEIPFTITFRNKNDLTKAYESPTLNLLVLN